MPTRGDSRGTLLRRTTTGLPIFEPPGEADDLEELDLPKLLLVGSAFYTGLNCCTYPLAVIKTRMQASAVSMGSLEAAGELWRISGIRGFYAGIGPVLLGALPARAGYITALEGTKAFWQARAEAAGVTGPTAAAASNGAAGFGAVLASQTIYTPCDVVTQRVMVASGSGGAAAADASAAHVVRDIWSTSGWSGFYRGFGVTLIAYLPGGSVWWAAYGGARSAASGQQLMPDLAELALAATWASLWTVAVTSPLDVLKTRVQLAPSRVAPPVLTIGRELLRSEGFAGLYRGFLPRWSQASIFSGSVISLYEHLKRICKK
ncbi:hypothetical protein EMIHUDRAFT_459688 [Emiliania huxleyi CCMP1516]|uniref:Mitochondrial carrier protein n=2 Tax=Emiliania huxleyi TaxID=2903 RepID=A0A0D3ILY3_EMIH1|nr:hypothetical protein EMIHUDRAFT_459688 [Emiliania huxleyi CCMP1516]EOD12268.1 hypothetical protein EMIHUDRAFT_459688 [Emiliania huxleyi CCMP1516]|eukprot:XP_005764697.1 hypothetical protein EMIHUDRAFT_459688 [Emiliania huxleyi CCMP1516]